MTCSSISRLGRTKIAAVRALSTATRELATCAPSVRRSAISSPDGSTTAMTTRWPRSSAAALGGGDHGVGAGVVDDPAGADELPWRQAPFALEDGGPDGGVGGDEEDVAVGPAEGEVDGAGQADLAEQLAVGRRRPARRSTTEA